MEKEMMEQLKKLLDQPGVRGKKYLRNFIWMNEAEPLYKKGECFEVTDRGHRILGKPVVRFHAKIEEVQFFPGDKIIRYKMVTKVKRGNREFETDLFVPEYSMGKKVEDWVNEFPEEEPEKAAM